MPIPEKLLDVTVSLKHALLNDKRCELIDTGLEYVNYTSEVFSNKRNNIYYYDFEKVFIYEYESLFNIMLPNPKLITFLRKRKIDKLLK